jgi:DNA-directed RNA polymerase specialized sigma subunit
MEDFYDGYNLMVKQIAAEFGRKYPMVEREDVQQELWLWFAEHPVKLDSWNKEHEDSKDVDKLVARSLRNAALDYCLKEKAIKSGYDPSDNFFYDKQFIKVMIPAVLSDDWSKIANTLSTGGRSTKALAESGDWMAFSADVKSAFDKLNDREQILVDLYYGQELTGTELVDAMKSDTTDKAIMMQANRALNKMVRLVGGTKPFKDEDYSYGKGTEDDL